MSDRPLWKTVKIRAEDLEPEDVTRDRFGKWNTVKTVQFDKTHTTVGFDGHVLTVRNVHLVDIQVVKPS